MQQPQAADHMSDPAALGFWQNRWQTGQTGWDLGGAHPLLTALLGDARASRCLNPGARILEPGAGRAHNGAALAAMGFDVTSFDGVAAAVTAARALYGDQPRLTLVQADALTVNPAWEGGFDAVFDRAMLCALPPEARRAYVQTAFAHLKPDGAFLSLLFSEVVLEDGKRGPPFQVTLPELSALTAAYFSLQAADERNTTVPGDRIRRETICVLRRRPRVLVEASEPAP